MTQEGKNALQFVAQSNCPINGYIAGSSYLTAEVFNIGCLFMVLGIREVTAKNQNIILKRASEYFEAVGLNSEDADYSYPHLTKENIHLLVGLSFNIYPTTAKEWATDLARIRRNNRRSA
jgi:hypothetical protein